ncbi:SDR family NAD(P)-dependent oxidoreductase [Phenylobacterium sp. LjRoot219]|uniref:SDR family oxidoreductase n=1 Tax=Phenylobacterium sp. LjRoot219 TaxID=3342283 RepID=UPI003ED15ED6
MRLKGKRAVITGASRGMGRKFAEALVAEGAYVAVVARPSEALDATVASLGKCAIAAPCDLLRPEQINAAIHRAAEAFDGLDILINNAGMLFPRAIAELPDSDLERQIGVNFAAPVIACRAAIPFMKAAGGGDIVNVSSESVKVPFPLLSIYGATKSALEYFTQVLRGEVRPDNIRVTTLRSGFIADTELGREWDPEQAAKFRSAIMSSGYANISGSRGAPPETMAEGLVSILALPREVTADIVELRPTAP